MGANSEHMASRRRSMSVMPSTRYARRGPRGRDRWIAARRQVFFKLPVSPQLLHIFNRSSLHRLLQEPHAARLATSAAISIPQARVNHRLARATAFSSSRARSEGRVKPDRRRQTQSFTGPPAPSSSRRSPTGTEVHFAHRSTQADQTTISPCS